MAMDDMYVKEFPDEYDVHLLTEEGEPTPRINLGRLENSQYWDSKLRIIGLLIFLSLGFLLLTLLSETNILQVMWEQLLAMIFSTPEAATNG